MPGQNQVTIKHVLNIKKTDTTRFKHVKKICEKLN